MMGCSSTRFSNLLHLHCYYSSKWWCFSSETKMYVVMQLEELTWAHSLRNVVAISHQNMNNHHPYVDHEKWRLEKLSCANLVNFISFLIVEIPRWWWTIFIGLSLLLVCFWVFSVNVIMRYFYGVYSKFYVWK